MVEGISQDELWNEYIDGDSENKMTALKLSKAVLHGKDDSDSSELS